MTGKNGMNKTKTDNLRYSKRSELKKRTNRSQKKALHKTVDERPPGSDQIAVKTKSKVLIPTSKVRNDLIITIKDENHSNIEGRTGHHIAPSAAPTRHENKVETELCNNKHFSLQLKKLNKKKIARLEKKKTAKEQKKAQMDMD